MKKLMVSPFYSNPYEFFMKSVNEYAQENTDVAEVELYMLHAQAICEVWYQKWLHKSGIL